MYITSIKIRNIRCIEHLNWKIEPDMAPGWHVILGDNGSGKSTFVQTIALCLIGSRDSLRLGQDIADWIREGAKICEASVDVAPQSDFDTGAPSDGRTLTFRAHGVRGNGSHSGSRYHPDARSNNGWFAASYGPMRRFTGGDAETDNSLKNHPRLARHQSAFSEAAALPESLIWLRDLRFRSLEGDDTARRRLDSMTAFINQPGFLPNHVQMEGVSPDGVQFRDGGGMTVLVQDLSEGYRSILSLTLDLLRHLALAYDTDIFDRTPTDHRFIVTVPGVVLIDEVDAHLHPTWQKEIGFWLCKHFPKIQFIVTTHSPLVCQAAVNGTIFRLPTPGSNEAGRFLDGQDRARLLYGDILDAYSTEAFGYGITRSEVSEKLLDRLADLNIKEVTSGLTSAEKAEQRDLRATLPSTASVLPTASTTV